MNEAHKRRGFTHPQPLGRRHLLVVHRRMLGVSKGRADSTNGVLVCYQNGAEAVFAGL